jgi:cap3/cap4 methyltransferase
MAAAYEKRGRAPNGTEAPSRVHRGETSGAAGSAANAAHAAAQPETLRPLYAPVDWPFPDAIAPGFPRRPYRTRRNEPKTAIHWGQRKLLLSEIQLLCEALTACGPNTKFTIVYAGAAPGTHLKFLDELFPGHLWELVDPIAFNVDILGPLTNFTLRNEYFTCGTASEYVARRMIQGRCPALASVFAHITAQDAGERAKPVAETANLKEGVEAVGEEATPLESLPKSLALLSRVAASRSPLLFVCDIRSGSVTQLNEAAAPTTGGGGNGGADDAHSSSAGPDAAGAFRGAEFEQHVAADMRAQMLWVEYLQPTFALLKFRLPYMEVYHPATRQVVYRHPDEHTDYLRGRALLPIWTRPTSTECRLLVPEGSPRVAYSNREYEDQCFFFNSVVRERIHFRHLVDDAPRETFLDHRYDGAAEANLLARYLQLQSSEPADVSAEAVLALSRRISDSLGKTFDDAAQRLPKIQLKKAAYRGFESSMTTLQTAADRCRQQGCWWTNQTGDEGDLTATPGVAVPDHSSWAWLLR